MKKPNKKQTATGIAVAITLVAGYFAADVALDKPQYETDLIEKSESGELTYDEYIKLVEEYNKALQKTKSNNEPFILENVNASESVIKKLNEKIK